MTEDSFTSCECFLLFPCLVPFLSRASPHCPPTQPVGEAGLSPESARGLMWLQFDWQRVGDNLELTLPE